MIGNLEPEETVLSTTWLQELSIKLKELGWEDDDDVTVEIGGTVTSGIRQPETANPKWSLSFGESRNNRDAFIIIKNQSRREQSKSSPLPDDVLREQFLENSSGQLCKSRELEELSEPTGVVVS